MGTAAVAEARRPIHLAMLVGASVAVYAVSLAGVTVLQSSADRAFIGHQAPTADAVARVRDGHDQLEADLAGAIRHYTDSSARYGALAANLAAMETSLASYAGRVETVSGAARALPGRVTLPKLSQAVASTAAKPRVRASTGASGG